ncbi:MAG: glutathione S-transferase family protein [Cyanobacteria bacterium]|nr:glutathione S-transferase family protein [Cyanobacteriota bacterium]MDA0867816.1 glutathione S-transferase family protein [Cyanobacteriota bacterium]
MLTLVIGNKNYSSWSLRAGLFLQESGLAFEEVRLPLFTEQWFQTIGQYTPAGRVPVLLDGDLAIWDSTAIMGHLQERHPEAVGWPSDSRARAYTRSIAAEMHSGFLALREELPQNIRARHNRDRRDFSSSAQKDIERIETIWQTGYQQYGGPWLGGEFSVADVMYAPVAMRFVTYGIQLAPAAQQFVSAIQALPSIQQWAKDSEAESEVLSFIDNLNAAGTGDDAAAV